MDISTGLGLLAGAIVVLTMIFMGGDLRMFISDHAVIIIFGGSFAATLIRFPLSSMFHGLPLGAKFAFTMRRMTQRELVDEIAGLAEIARKQGPIGGGLPRAFASSPTATTPSSSATISSATALSGLDHRPHLGIESAAQGGLRSLEFVRRPGQRGPANPRGRRLSAGQHLRGGRQGGYRSALSRGSLHCGQSPGDHHADARGAAGSPWAAAIGSIHRLKRCRVGSLRHVSAAYTTQACFRPRSLIQVLAPMFLAHRR